MKEDTPGGEYFPELELRPGEDVMDFVERESKRLSEESDRKMAEFEAFCRATKEKFEEVVFYSNLASKVWDETAARIRAIRAQDEPKPPSTELPPGS